MGKQKPIRFSRKKRSPNSIEEDWMMVKKQRITILIPPLPGTEPQQTNQKLEADNSPLSSTARLPLPLPPNKTNLAEVPVTPPTASRDLAHPNAARLVSKAPDFRICTESGVLLDHRMRAWLIDKKLERAGGLEKWLVSLGLNCFVKAFISTRLSKFQLIKLDMKTLKDMGFDAVGPRRKLIHAINCVSESPCFHRGSRV